ncbi:MULTISPECIES: cyclic nucleotide-binding and patatin-like phospholipase domain-containing protein [unclassified Acidovorax]|uniref:patatin-like phospholipase family protein n=1 Tax=unclassified Acidovorax TaxID=2684926 RepID=UPI001C473B5B|nr:MULTISPECIES: cyclic nucleotide-binding and patatin-like phospholipase domain-containing protein [unclassified Acidovorax]MBV7430231.1 patatin-like phospholipase family protein [Acidovorax sp. sif0732]MBV7451624.1 patatin-like phospholipase family protein [Acidovorax sp. sif0715]
MPPFTATQNQLLTEHLRSFLHGIEPEALELLRAHLEWVEVPGGSTLMAQGEPGESMYLTVSGRLRAYVRGDDGHQRRVADMGRGQVIGEISLFTDAPRAATVVAVRDSVLVRLTKDVFKTLLASSAQVSIALTRQIIQRLQSGTAANVAALERPVAMGLLPISAGVDLQGFGQGMARQLGLIGRVRVVDSATVDAELREAGIAQREGADATANRRIAMLLDEIEARNDFVLLVADPEPTPWTRRVSRHCDELLLLADAQAEPALHAIEEQCLLRRAPLAEAAEILVLLHPAGTRCPQGTQRWLDRRPVADHLHVRPALDRDMARLARIQSRTAVGLVLAGGGARGFAHLGVYRALQEEGVEIDCVGGTSIGSVMAAYVASDQPLEAVMANAREAFRTNPTGDFNLLPLLSLIKGRRLRHILHAAVERLVGFPAQIEDLWKNYYCVATNYSRASEQVVRRGSLVKSLLASISIPGALPPVVHEGDLLCDGGTFNNFPVDVMRGMRGVGTVIGVDLNFRKPRRIDLDDVPTSWALLRDKLRPRAKRRYRLPSLASYLMNVTILYSMSRQRQSQQLTDLYFNPPMDRVGMLQWNRFEQIVQQGYAHGTEVLDALDAVRRQRIGGLRAA